MAPFIWKSRTRTSIGTESRLVLLRAEGESQIGNKRMVAKRHWVSFWGNNNVLKLTVVAHICDYTKNH